MTAVLARSRYRRQVSLTGLGKERKICACSGFSNGTIGWYHLYQFLKLPMVPSVKKLVQMGQMLPTNGSIGRTPNARYVIEASLTRKHGVLKCSRLDIGGDRKQKSVSFVRNIASHSSDLSSVCRTASCRVSTNILLGFCCAITTLSLRFDSALGARIKISWH